MRVQAIANPRMRNLPEVFDLSTTDMRVIQRRTDQEFRFLMRRLWATEGASGGEPWAPLSGRYAKRKRRKYRGRRKILAAEGDMRRAATQRGINHIATHGLVPEPFVKVGLRDPKAVFHSGHRERPNPKLPVREILQFTDEQKQALIDIWRDYLVTVKLKPIVRAMQAAARHRGGSYIPPGLMDVVERHRGAA